MNAGRELRKAAVWHLAAGSTFSALLFLVIFLGKYETRLLVAIVQYGKIKATASVIKNAELDMDSSIKKITGLSPSGGSFRSREMMLIYLDEIKDRVRGARLNVQNFEQKGAELTLPVSISIPVYSYRAMVEDIGYFQSMRLPYFRIDRITLNKPEDKRYTCVVEGALVMPSDGLNPPGRGGGRADG